MTYVSSPLRPNRSFSQKNGGKWTKELYKACHDTVLVSLLAGRHQPTVRIGAIRPTHNFTSTNKACVHCQ